MEPPGLDEEYACCRLGDSAPLPPIPFDPGSSVEYEHPPRIGWGNGRWGIVFVYNYAGIDDLEWAPQMAFYQLERGGTLLDDGPTILEPLAALQRPLVASPQAVRWFAGRWVIPMAGDSAVPSPLRVAQMLFLDAETRLAQTVALGSALDGAIDATYVAHGNRWLGFAANPTSISVTAYSEDEGGLPPVQHSLGTVAWLRAASMRSRAAVLLGSGNPLHAGPSEVAVLGSDGSLLGRIPLGRSEVREVSVVAARDLALTATNDGSRIVMRAVDPFALRTVGEHLVIGEAVDGGSGLAALGMASLDKFGLVGICWGRSGDDLGRHDTRLMFRATHSDGSPYGRAVVIADVPFRGAPANCAVGSDATGFLVAWWAGQEIWTRRVEVN